MIRKEFCAENFTRVPEAVERGADRIELCDRLDLGGTTPSKEVIRETVAYAKQHGVEVIVMIRPRGGSFVYSEAEKAQMLKEAEQAVNLSVDGIVSGALTKDNEVDWPFLDDLLKRTGDRQMVFHMAFDGLPRERQLETLDGLIERGVTRLLTRGGPHGSALENSHWINELSEKAGRGLEILAGGGITADNLNQAIEKIRTSQFHGTKIVFD
ncbi:copper homeostasis protein [Alkalibacterium subtropicum]|uniref:PF03932 family protein CutC n=1 Tax=Alkalibacterium subtropicum TaxID=753702 RepID=A0A1I1H5X6_9LACT|nr:copper homeostasis protein CutC [Alkalibacterium subtropicum]SFC16833.1 copper homeostasis protein [Alkalibacterium subtropicum]